jgi:hypothetical protein
VRGRNAKGKAGPEKVQLRSAITVFPGYYVFPYEKFGFRSPTKMLKDIIKISCV